MKDYCMNKSAGIGYTISLLQNELKQNVKMILQDPQATQSVDQPALGEKVKIFLHRGGFRGRGTPPLPSQGFDPLPTQRVPPLYYF